MTFNEWFYGLEGFSLRCERFDADLIAFQEDAVGNKRIEEWLKCAYDVGYEDAMGRKLDDGK